MRNIFNIMWHDLKRCGSSVVAIITIMGLCIVPCLYAWFNILSNWQPYESEATGRISVIVANEDKGSETLGLSINVGDKIVTGLEANDAIGWSFTDSAEKAKEGVLSGDYYAALVIPEDFSKSVLSFVNGDLKNPKLKYYENEKKNAIAPKITGKAKTAVIEQVNATFVETLADYVAKGVSVADATGLDPQGTIGDLSERLSLLSQRLDDCIVMLDAATSLSSAAESLLAVSGTLTDSANEAIDADSKVLDTASDIIPEESTEFIEVTKSVTKINKETASNIRKVESKINKVKDDMDLYNDFVKGDLPAQKKIVSRMIKANKIASESLKKLGLNALGDQFAEQAADLEAISKILNKLVPATEENWPEMQQNVQDILNIITNAEEKGGSVTERAEEIATSLEKADLEALDKKLRKSLSEASSAITEMQDSLEGLGGLLGQLGSIFDGYNGSLGDLDGNLYSTRADLLSMQSGIDVLADLMARVSGNEDLSEANRILSENTENFASYLASPVKMNTEVIYPIETYGSAMAPFYTVLAQWVGALLTAVLIKTGVKKRDDLPNPNMFERFFGRYGLYLFIGLAQALIVSLGDLLYVGIQCHSPLRFVLAACVNGICFTMINYALVFALDNIGLGLGVIVLVMQVAGSGGTYPVEVLPKVFRVLFPFMPFRYSMDAMRECIAGMYDHTYSHCLAVLGLFILGSIVFGLVLYKPALGLNRLIAQSKEKSEIML